MRKIISVFIGCVVMVLPLLSYGFDCYNPEFGARLEVLNKDGHFVKYMEKNGITYYRYTGECGLEKHFILKAAISYAFVKNRLYARLINLTSSDGSHEDNRKFLEKEVYSKYGISLYEIKVDGDWWVYQWPIESGSLKHKMKINSKTQAIKDVYYDESLRSQLNVFDDADDFDSLVN
jgi:hypothetical protein